MSKNTEVRGTDVVDVNELATNGTAVIPEDLTVDNLKSLETAVNTASCLRMGIGIPQVLTLKVTLRSELF